MSTPPQEKGSRTRILRAAAELFAVKGYGGASTTAIARHAGVSQPALHYHFGSKRLLFMEALRWADREFAASFTPGRDLSGLAKIQQLEITLRRFGHEVFSDPMPSRLIYSAAINDEFQSEIGAIVKSGIDELRHLFRELIDEKVIRDIDEAALVEMAVGSIEQAAAVQGMMSSAYEKDFTDARVRTEFINAAVDIFIQGVRLEPESG